MRRHGASPLDAASFAADLAACRALLADGSKSFHAASRALPAWMRARACALYAFCRVADDAIDLGDAGPETVEALARRVDAIFAGSPIDHPADRAFAAVVAAVAMPRVAVDALIEGFAWDAQGRRYQTYSELEAYAVRVAGAVGVMMAVVMERRAADVLARASDLGVAMQFTNIARDVGEDARAGRLYLPIDWLRAEGIDPDAFLADPRFTPALGRVVARLLDEAERFYARAEAGYGALPARCRAGMRAAGLLYREIGREVARAGHDSVGRRVRTGRLRKAALLIRASAPTLPAFDARLGEPAAPQAVELVQAAAGSCVRRAPPWWDLAGNLITALSVIEKLERADRGATSGRMARTA